MKTRTRKGIDTADLNARLRRWRELHNTPEKRAALFREKIPEWVAQSMAFENQPVSIERVKTLLKNRGKVPKASEAFEEIPPSPAKKSGKRA